MDVLLEADSWRHRKGSATVLVTGPAELLVLEDSQRQAPRAKPYSGTALSCPSAFCLTFPTPFPLMKLRFRVKATQQANRALQRKV